jgi:hypothetical protein
VDPDNREGAQPYVKLSFTRTNGPVDDAVDNLMALVGEVRHPELVREMILAALKAGQEGEDRAGLKLMNTTLKEMRFTAKVFGPYSSVKKVTVFGSARTEPGEPLYELASFLGSRLAAHGYMVITGGGPGIMHAVNEGAGAEHSFGVNIRLPFEQRTNPVLEGNPRAIMYKYFFNRKVAFLKEASAIVLFPGGFGTLDEAMETLTLLQTGKRAPLPLLLLDEPGGTYWDRCVRFFKDELLSRTFIDPDDLLLFECVRSADEAVARINRFYRRFHSLRYVDGQLVVRLASPLDADSVAGLRSRFQDILSPSGDMRASEAFPQESDEPDTLDLPRLVLDFNRKNFSRLRALIDAINSL